MDDAIARSLELRFEARNEVFAREVKRILQDQNARDMLISGTTLQLGYDALVTELVESRHTIVTAIADQLAVIQPRNPDPDLTEKAKAMLQDRAAFLDRFYLEKTRAIRNALANEKMHADYATLSRVMPLNESEIVIEATQAVNRYLSQRPTTYQKIMARFMDHPLIAVGAIILAGVMYFLGVFEDLWAVRP